MKNSIYLMLAIFLLTNCSVNKSENDEDRLIINNDETELSNRTLILDQVLEVDTTSENGFRSKKVNFDLKLENELSSPVLNGTTLQANMISIDEGNSRWLISYNVQGATYLGGVDVAQVTGNGKNINLRSNVGFLDSDVNAVITSDNFMYAALSTSNIDITDDGERSVIQRITMSGFSIVEETSETNSVPSFAGTSVFVDDDVVLITSGNTGGVSIFNEDLNELGYVEIQDARWVQSDNENIYVLAGDSDGDNQGSIIIIDKINFQIINTYPFEGAYTPESKNNFEVVNNLAIIAAGFEGVKFMDLTNGSILATINIPDASELGLPESVVTTNSVSVDDDKIFISNGEAGVYVAESDIEIENIVDDSFEITMLGKIQFGDLESVNHVTYRNKLLLVAAGIGGVKVVSLTDK